MARKTRQSCEGAALGYRRLGWSVIPLRAREKIPKLAWQEFQDRRAEDDEIRGWFKRWPKANVGIVRYDAAALRHGTSRT